MRGGFQPHLCPTSILSAVPGSLFFQRRRRRCQERTRTPGQRQQRTAWTRLTIPFATGIVSPSVPDRSTLGWVVVLVPVLHGWATMTFRHHSSSLE